MLEMAEKVASEPRHSIEVFSNGIVNKTRSAKTFVALDHFRKRCRLVHGAVDALEHSRHMRESHCKDCQSTAVGC